MLPVTDEHTKKQQLSITEPVYKNRGMTRTPSRVFLIFCPIGVWQGSVTASAANVWRDWQRVVWGKRQRRRDTPGAAGWMSAVGHSFSTPSVRYPQFPINLETFLLLSERGDQRLMLIVEINFVEKKTVRSCIKTLFFYLLIYWLCVCVFVCHSGLWGLSWCLPVMRASSGMLLR